MWKRTYTTAQDFRCPSHTNYKNLPTVRSMPFTTSIQLHALSQTKLAFKQRNESQRRQLTASQAASWAGLNSPPNVSTKWIFHSTQVFYSNMFGEDWDFSCLVDGNFPTCTPQRSAALYSQKLCRHYMRTQQKLNLRQVWAFPAANWCAFRVFVVWLP